MVEEKPEGYADAPQWQKDAWDSDTNKLMKMAADVLKDPKVVGGWCVPSETLYANYGVSPEMLYANYSIPPAPEFPEISVKRGGLKWPRFRVETMIVRSSRRWFWQKFTWKLHVRYWDAAQQRHAHHIMEGFPAENLAVNAAEIIKFVIQTINEDYWREKDAR